MTIASIANKKQYDGNDVTTDFAFPYKFILDSHLVVVLTDINDVDTILILDTDYTVTGAGDEGGGTVTYPLNPFGTPLATGEVLTIYREVSNLQGIDLSNQGAFFLEILEDSLDYLTMITQQVQEKVDRCVKTTVTDPDDPPTLANFNQMVEDGLASLKFIIDGLTILSNDNVANNDKIPIVDVTGDALNYVTPDGIIAGAKRAYGSKGADIASSNVLILGNDGNYFHVTGSLTIKLIGASAGTYSVGAEVTLVFDSALTIEHSAINLVLPSGNDIKTKAGDIMIFRLDDGGKWRLIAANRPIDAKNADIASATTLPVLAPGYADVTGSVTITAFASIGIGSELKLQFDAAPRLTHHATDLILPGGANITPAAGDEAEFKEYEAGKWRCVNYMRASGLAVVVTPQLIRDISRGLIVKTGTDTDHDIDIDADEIILQNTGGDSYRATSVNLTMAGDATVGINALDAGSLANNTWYYLWVIYNGTTVASLGSTSSTAPTMPSGYTYKALVGAMTTDGSANFLGFYQQDNCVEYSAVQTIKSDASFASGAWTSQSITSFFPSTTKRIKIFFGSNGNYVALSPRSDGHAGSYFCASGAATDYGIFPASHAQQATLELRYAAAIYYYTNNATASLLAVGWEY